MSKNNFKIHCFRGKLKNLDVRDERHAEIDGEAAHGVVDEDALGELVGEHEHLGDLYTENGQTLQARCRLDRSQILQVLSKY